MKKVVVLLMVVLIPCALFAGVGHEVKDPNPAIGNEGPMPRATGGPDAFGYVWHDQNEADVSYSWIEISATGSSLGSGDDSTYSQTLDFPFDFYGTTYSRLDAITNGFLSTATDSGVDLTNDCPLPASPSTGTGARVYAVHDDLVVDGSIYYQYFSTCPRADNTGATPGCMVFQWHDARHYGDSSLFDFEVVLYDGSFEIAVQTAAGNPEAGSGSTTGIQDENAAVGLSYACDTAGSVPDNTAVAFFIPGQGQPTPTPTPVEAIPTMNSWGMLVFLMGIFGVAVLVLRRRF